MKDSTVLLEQDGYRFIVFETNEPHREAIAALFEHCFERPLSPEFWAWWYRSGTAGATNIYSAYEVRSNTLIATHSMRQCPVLIAGKPALVSHCTNAATHSEHRRNGLFHELVRLSVAEEMQRGATHLMAYPCRLNSYNAFVKAGWTSVCELEFFERGSVATGTRGEELQQQLPDDVSLRVLQSRLSTTSNFVACRTESSLRWRYHQRPNTRYDCFTLPDARQGYVVLKRYRAESKRLLHVVELVADSSDAARRLLRFAISKAQDAEVINLWAGPWHRYHPVILELGFQPASIAPNILFMVGPHVEDLAASKPLLVNLGDNDVF